MKKKLIAILMTALTICSLAACGKTNAPAASGNQTAGQNEEIYRNVIIALMESNVWDNNSKYVVTKDDLKQYFETVNEDNNFYQLTLSKGLAGIYDPDNAEAIVNGDNGAKYRYLCPADIYGSYINMMYGADEDFYKQLTFFDLAKSSLYYDEDTDAIYYFEGLVSTKNCTFEESYMDNYASCYVYYVTDQADDDTTLKGHITVKVGELDCAGWDVELESVSFKRK